LPWRYLRWIQAQARDGQGSERRDERAYRRIAGWRYSSGCNAYEEYGHDESRAFAVAHHAAKQAGKKEGAT
jgi:hypothetical protein